jgi:hypothetical protein
VASTPTGRNPTDAASEGSFATAHAEFPNQKKRITPTGRNPFTVWLPELGSNQRPADYNAHALDYLITLGMIRWGVGR